MSLQKTDKNPVSSPAADFMHIKMNKIINSQKTQFGRTASAHKKAPPYGRALN